MATRPDYQQTKTAPETGIYRQMNVLGSPTNVRIRVERGTSLPNGPIGFTWRLEEATVEDQEGGVAIT